MRRALALLFCLAALLGISGCGAESASAPVLLLRYADNQPADYPTTRAAEYFAALVRERTGGQVDIRVFPDSELGNEIGVFEQMRFGGVDFARVSVSTLAEFVPELGIMQLPYLFDDAEHMRRVLDGEIGDELLSRVSGSGVVGLSWFEAGARNFYTRVPVTCLEDLEGLTIRVQESDFHSRMIRLLGAVPVQIPYSGVYSALQIGRIDGAENNWPSYEATGHYEAAPYYLLDAHWRLPEAQIVSGVTLERIRALTQYGCDKASLLSIPYTFVNEDHFWNFAESELAQEFLNEPQEIGLPLRGLCYGEEGFRHFFFKNPVSGIEDLKGLKIRVSSDPVMTGMVTNLGASATTVSFTELYSALNTGVVDGAEQPTANYRSNAFQEVAPYLLLDGHTLGALQIVISDAGWAKLNEEQQGWVMEAAKYASSVCREKVAEIEAETFAQLEKDGATVIPVEDKAPWVEACQPTIQANTAKLADLYQQILDLQ